MAKLSLLESFDKYFEIQFASTKKQRQASYRIRHCVYADELGWEPTKSNGLETDEYDTYAFPLLLRHKSSGQCAGTVRLIIPPLNNPAHKLPFEDQCSELIDRSLIDPQQIPRGAFGEVSRLAVPAGFRRRNGEVHSPDGFNATPTGAFSDEDRRAFPNIAIGLYLSALSLSALCNHVYIFVVAQPRLVRLLARLGFNFQPCSPTINYHGERALFYTATDVAIDGLKPDVRALFDRLHQQLMSQIHLFPYVPQDICA